MTMLSKRSIKLVFVSAKFVKRLTSFIQLSLGFVNSFLSSVVVSCYSLGFLECFIISFFSSLSFIVLSAIAITVSILEVGIRDVLILVTSLRTSCSLLTLSSLAIFINRLVQAVLIGISTIKSFASFIQLNGCIINLSFKLFR